jgi:hypothetical protein
MSVSRVSHDPTKNYLEVQFNQDVSLLDSELNELQKIFRGSLEDTRRVLLGVSFFGDELKVTPGDTPNSVKIKAGTLFYKGLRIHLTEDKIVSFLSTPLANRTDCVFIEFYETEIDPTEDPNLLDPAVGAETSQRLKLEYFIRVVEGVDSPTPSGSVSFIQLGRLNRLTGEPNITESQIVDDRSKSIHTYVIDGCAVRKTGDFQITVGVGSARVATVDMVVEEEVVINIPSNSTRYIFIQNDTVQALSSRPLAYACTLAIVQADSLGITILDRRDFIPMVYRSEASAETEQLPKPPIPDIPSGSLVSKYKAAITIAQFKVVHLTNTSNVVNLASNTTSATAPVIAIAMQAVGVNQIGSFMKNGEITNPSWNWQLNKPIFLGTNGDLTQTPPTTPYTIIQKVAFPVSAQTIEFNPSLYTIRN